MNKYSYTINNKMTEIYLLLSFFFIGDNVEVTES